MSFSKVEDWEKEVRGGVEEIIYRQQQGLAMQSTNRYLPPQLQLDGSTLYASQGSIYALEVTSGLIRQSYSISGIAFPTIGVVCVGANDGYVYALRASDGMLMWQTFISTDVTSAAGISISSPDGIILTEEIG